MSGSVEAARITYLVANHGHARYLPDCIASLRAQTDDRWLALIADDGSTDDSLAVIRALLEPRIRVLENGVNIGYTRTLQRLIENATTDIVGILDADDALHPEATARLLAVYEADDDSSFVYSRFAVYDETLTDCLATHGSAVPAGDTALRAGVVGAIRSFRRSAYARTAGLDPELRYAEDRDLVYKLEEVTRPVMIDAVLYRYRHLPTSQSHDPVKHEIGARNTLRARRAAVRRRRVTPIRRALWDAYFVADYLAYSRSRPAAVRTLAMLGSRVIMAGAGWLLNGASGVSGTGRPTG
ncbi:MAG: glycosyltransferase family 2 protein [Longimicrobiales bacterium]